MGTNLANTAKTKMSIASWEHVVKKLAARIKIVQKLIIVEAQVYAQNATIPKTLARKVIRANLTSHAKKISVIQATSRLVTEIFTNSVSEEHVNRLLAQVIRTALTIQLFVRLMGYAFTIRTNVTAMTLLPVTDLTIIAKPASVS
jgi:hypothetical protein